MFYTEKNKLLVIGIPKTGTVSIERALVQQLDPLGSFHRVIIEGKDNPPELFKQGMINHARAREFKEVLGDDYNKLTTIAFLRNPYAKLVSIYHFTKDLKLISIPKGKKKVFYRAVRYTLSVLLAKLLPFNIWINFYPYRSSSSYIRDYDGKVIVNYIGRTENMEEDLNKFLRKSKIIDKNNFVSLKKENNSQHKHWTYYYKNASVLSKAKTKMKQDIDDYEFYFGKIKLKHP